MWFSFNCLTWTQFHANCCPRALAMNRWVARSFQKNTDRTSFRFALPRAHTQIPPDRGLTWKTESISRELWSNSISPVSSASLVHKLATYAAGLVLTHSAEWLMLRTLLALSGWRWVNQSAPLAATAFLKARRRGPVTRVDEHMKRRPGEGNGDLQGTIMNQHYWKLCFWGRFIDYCMRRSFNPGLCLLGKF